MADSENHKYISSSNLEKHQAQNKWVFVEFNKKGCNLKEFFPLIDLLLCCFKVFQLFRLHIYLWGNLE